MNETDEAEITVYMRFQRAGAGGNPVEMQFIKWTAEGMVKGHFAAGADFCCTGAKGSDLQCGA